MRSAKPSEMGARLGRPTGRRVGRKIGPPSGLRFLIDAKGLQGESAVETCLGEPRAGNDRPFSGQQGLENRVGIAAGGRERQLDGGKVARQRRIAGCCIQRRRKQRRGLIQSPTGHEDQGRIICPLGRRVGGRARRLPPQGLHQGGHVTGTAGETGGQAAGRVSDTAQPALDRSHAAKRCQQLGTGRRLRELGPAAPGEDDSETGHESDAGRTYTPTEDAPSSGSHLAPRTSTSEAIARRSFKYSRSCAPPESRLGCEDETDRSHAAARLLHAQEPGARPWPDTAARSTAHVPRTAAAGPSRQR
jgi:hypothetical protein